MYEETTASTTVIQYTLFFDYGVNVGVESPENPPMPVDPGC